MRELMLKKGIWISVLVCVLALLLGVPFLDAEPPMETGSFLKYFQEALQSQVTVFLVPILAALPAGAAYVQEKSSGFLKLYSIRMNRMEYIKRKLFQNYVSGFLPFFLAGLVVFLVCFLFLYPLELVGEVDRKEAAEAAALWLRLCLMGGLLAEISGVFAALFQNYYMAYGLPFVCYYMLVILKDRYLPDLYAMYPVEWLVCKKDWGSDGSGIWLFFLAFTAAVVLLHGILLYERIRELA